MSFVFDILFQIIVELLLGGVGALVLWAKKGFKGSVKEIYVENQNLSILIGVIFWVLLITTIVLIF